MIEIDFMTKVDAVLTGVIVILLISMLASLISWVIFDRSSFNKFCSYFYTSSKITSATTGYFSTAYSILFKVSHFNSGITLLASEVTFVGQITALIVSSAIVYGVVWVGAEVINKIKRGV